VFLPAAAAAAQSAPPIVTDRPTQSAATFVISPKVLQIEGGYRFTRLDDAGTVTDVQTFPDALFRFGIISRVEARLTASGADITSVAAADATERSTSFNDISLGAKFAVAEERGARPAFSILADVTLPVGSDELAGGLVSPKLLVLISSTISDHWALTANIGPTVSRNSDETVTDLEYAAAIGATINSRFAAFAEFYGAFAFSETRLDGHNFQTGITALLGSDGQFDARVGFGLVAGVPDVLLGFGLSWRLFSSNVRTGS
jgi:hypothetical protein